MGARIGGGKCVDSKSSRPSKAMDVARARRASPKHSWLSIADKRKREFLMLKIAILLRTQSGNLRPAIVDVKRIADANGFLSFAVPPHKIARSEREADSGARRLWPA